MKTMRKETMLDLEIKRQIEIIRDCSPEDRKAELEHLDNLIEARDKLDNRKFSRRMEIANLCIGIAGVGVGLAGVMAPLMFYQRWLNAGFEYERDGVITSNTFNNFIGKIKPTSF